MRCLSAAERSQIALTSDEMGRVLILREERLAHCSLSRSQRSFFFLPRRQSRAVPTAELKRTVTQSTKQARAPAKSAEGKRCEADRGRPLDDTEMGAIDELLRAVER